MLPHCSVVVAAVVAAAVVAAASINYHMILCILKRIYYYLSYV